MNDVESMNFVWVNILSDKDKKEVEGSVNIQHALLTAMSLNFKDIVSTNPLKDFKGRASLNSIPDDNYEQ